MKQTFVEKFSQIYTYPYGDSFKRPSQAHLYRDRDNGNANMIADISG